MRRLKQIINAMTPERKLKLALLAAAVAIVGGLTTVLGYDYVL